MNTATAPHDLANRVLVEQIKMLNQSVLPTLFINLVVGAGLVYGLWNEVAHTTLLVWLGLLVTMVVVRAVFYFVYLHRFTPEKVKLHGWFLILGSSTAGLIWGLGSVAMYPVGNLDYQLLILVILIGMASGSIFSLYSYLPALYAFFPMAMLPFALRMLAKQDPIHLSLGSLTIFYVLALIFFSIRVNRSLKASLALRFENLALVDQLREQKAEADRANQAKSKFLAAASHDLRQPLYALSLFTSILDESITYPKVRRVVDQIKASVNSLQSSFNALLDISQLDAQAKKFEKTDFFIKPLLENLANEFNVLANQKGLQIHWPDTKYSIHSDPQLIEQILRNYISNAIRYTAHGTITILCEARNREIVFSVKDTGIGIAPENLSLIFEEFRQVGNPERDRAKGLGLGLAIVKRTADLLGHPIEVTSQLGEGSTFFLRVQRARLIEKLQAIDQRAHEERAHEDGGQLASSLVVVIDDVASVREGTKSLFELWHCEVVSAASEAEALNLLRQLDRVPDAIVADYRLRDNKTGIEAVQAIQAEYRSKIPALIVSGEMAIEDMEVLQRGGFQLLRKPVAAEKLHAFLHQMEGGVQTDPTFT